MSSWPELESFEHSGLQVRVGVEEDTRMFDPREAECNLGTMVCWHTDYVLGDFQLRDGSGRGAVETVYPPDERGRRGITSMRMLHRYLELVERAPAILPLYLYDHSGISMSAGSPSRWDNPVVRSDEFGRGLGWDSSMVGFIYSTPERIVELCGEPQVPSDAFYCPRTWPEDGRSGRNWPAERSASAWLVSQLEAEVSVYDEWLRGEVYWYSVGTAEEPYMDGCGGFLGGAADADGRPIDSFEYVKREAREAAEALAAELALDVEPDLEAALHARVSS